MIAVYIVALLICFVLLARIVDLFFISSLDKISKDLRLSNDAAGATLMAMGSSAPELFVALFAVIKPGEHQGIGIGSIVGSAIFNLLIIIGASAIAREIFLKKKQIIRDLSFYALAVGLLVFFISDGTFTLAESAIFLAVYVLYVFAIFILDRQKVLQEKDDPLKIVEDEYSPKSLIQRLFEKVIKFFDTILNFIFPSKEWYYIVFSLSIVLIAVISYVLVEVAVKAALILNIPEAIIALTVLAVGTSIPDLLSSVIVARQGRGDMAVSNAIGSNIFDILVGLGLPFFIVMLISGGSIGAGGDLLASSVILFASVLILVVILFFTKGKIGGKIGIAFIGIYILYVLWEIFFR